MGKEGCRIYREPECCRGDGGFFSDIKQRFGKGLQQYIKTFPTYERTVAYRSKIVSDLIIYFRQRKSTVHGLLNADFTRCGAIGVSLGGSAAMANALDDSRVLAAVNFDGFHYAKVPFDSSY